MKVKVISERKVIEKELDIEYPYYLYFQDEYCLNDELQMVDKEFSIIVNCGMSHNSIKVKQSIIHDAYVLENNLTTKEHFFEIYNMVSERLEELLNKENE